MFQLKNFVSIAASMLNYVRSTTGKVTDLQPGSVTRTILEAPAAEIEELYVQVFNGIREAIPVAVYESIQFDKLAPQYAAGRVTVTAKTAPTQAFAIPKGTNFLSRDGRIYQSVADMTWPSGVTSLQIPVISQLAGTAQNLSQGEINASPSFAPDLYSFSNTAMINGSDLESDDARKIRFAEYISALSRGTEAALIYGAKTAQLLDSAGNITEAVERVSLISSTGVVTVYIWGSSGTPSAALITRVQDVVNGYKDVTTGTTVAGYSAAGIKVNISPLKSRTIDASVRITLLSGNTFDQAALEAQVKDTMDTFLNSIQPGTTVYVDDVQTQIMMIRGVQSARVTTSQNLSCGKDEILSAGKVTVTQ
ncbi:hypothetical protein GTB64_004489 [Salmonella enterica]|nr:hypothetical protein [Salmonella enterica]